MCHLILLMPIVGLVVFWILPLSAALPVYLVILAASAVLYYLILKSMRRPVTTGAQTLVGKSATVVEASGNRGEVHVEGAIWQATSDDTLAVGDRVMILSIEGLTLKVARDTQSQTDLS